MGVDRRFADPRTGRCPRYAPLSCSPSIRYMLRKDGMQSGDVRHAAKLSLPTCCSQQVQYKRQVPRGPRPGVRDSPELQYVVPKMSPTKNASMHLSTFE